MSPEPQSFSNEELRQQVEALNVTLIGLDTRLHELMTKSEADARFPTREENRRIRKRVTLTILASVLIALAVGTFGNNYAVNRCFLQGSPDKNTFCNTFFPGYNNAVDDNNVRLTQFRDLLKTIPKNTATNDKQQAQLDEMTRVLNELARKNNIAPITTK